LNTLATIASQGARLGLGGSAGMIGPKPFRPAPSKAELRREAEAAIAGYTAPSSVLQHGAGVGNRRQRRGRNHDRESSSRAKLTAIRRAPGGMGCPTAC
jgi:hypothetical protein